MFRRASLSRRLLLVAMAFIAVALVVAAVAVGFALHRFVQGQIDQRLDSQVTFLSSILKPKSAVICMASSASTMVSFLKLPVNRRFFTSSSLNTKFTPYQRDILCAISSNDSSSNTSHASCSLTFFPRAPTSPPATCAPAPRPALRPGAPGPAPRSPSVAESGTVAAG